MQNVGGKIRCIVGDVQVAYCIVCSTNMAALSRSCKPRIVLFKLKLRKVSSGVRVFERLTEFKFVRGLHKIVHTTTELMVSRIFFVRGSDSVRTSRDSKNRRAQENSSYTKLKRKFLVIFSSLC